MFNKHIDDLLTKGKWSFVHKENQLENISEAFDQARDTELLKNKPQ